METVLVSFQLGTTTFDESETIESKCIFGNHLKPGLSRPGGPIVRPQVCSSNTKSPQRPNPLEGWKCFLPLCECAVIPHRPPDEREVKTKSYLQLLAAGPEVVDEVLIAKIGAPVDLFSIVVVIFTQPQSCPVANPTSGFFFFTLLIPNS